MTVLVPKTKFEELTEELDSIDSLPREQALHALEFFSKRAMSAISKKLVANYQELELKAKIAVIRGDVETTMSFTSGLCSLLGTEGRWRQFVNFVHLGLLHEGYKLICNIEPKGLELTNVTWLALLHALNGKFESTEQCLEYISHAYPKIGETYQEQLSMVKTAFKLATSLSSLKMEFSITKAIETAIVECIPASILSTPGVNYFSSTTECPDGENVLLDLQLVPHNQVDDELVDISRKFSRVLQCQLPEDVTDIVMIGINFSDQ